MIGRFGPPLAVMALIWLLSSQPDLSTGLGFWDFVLRKLAHMTVFGVLLLTWWRAVGPRAAAVVTLAYAATDEWHQTWVHGRHGAFSDWLVDAAGAAIAATLFLAWRARSKRAAN